LRGALVSDISPESIEDPEVPVEDAIEQHEPLQGGRDRDEEQEDFELPDEANPADVAEQHQEVQPDEEQEDFELPDEANPADVAEQHQEVQPDEDEDTYR
jgi:hypothetical protein